ncbi:MAG: PEP/pyruvate-binding domain-containing protein [Patescibacteria group bacterium]|nr:PEP/pyruvate-binding domain-containing protein [Patescibacteria group bacterium]
MFIKNFKQLSYKDVSEAGGKGASLGEITNAGLSVPPGFVLLANVFDRFLEETDLNAEIAAVLKKVNYKDINSVDKASNVIRDLIDDQDIPADIKKEILVEFKKLKSKFVAVRSSATAEDSSVASWAGELETYLDTTEKNLLENVKKCWSSLFTPRAIFYRQEKKMLKTKVSVAVVVQQMIDSEISGIAFTVHPVTRDKNQMIIEAGWGLGEAIVSGQVTPDAYVIDKRDLSIIDINVAKQEMMIVRKAGGGIKHTVAPKAIQEKQKFNGKQIIELAKICAAIEKHYKKPQDIEWAFAKGKFYITQSRPITTL